MDLPIPMKYKPRHFSQIPRMTTIIESCSQRRNGDFFVIQGEPNNGKSLVINILNSLNQDSLVIDGSDDVGTKTEAKLRAFAQSPIEVSILIDDVDLVNDKMISLICSFCDAYSHKLAIYATCTNLAGISPRFKARFSTLKIPPVTDNVLKVIAKEIFSSENILISDESLEYIVSKSSLCIPLLLCNIEKAKLIDEYSRTFWDKNSVFSESDRSQALKLRHYCIKGDYQGAIDTIREARENGFTILDILHVLNNSLHLDGGYANSAFINVSKLVLTMIVDVSNGGAETNSIHEYQLVNSLIKSFRQVHS